MEYLNGISYDKNKKENTIANKQHKKHTTYFLDNELVMRTMTQANEQKHKIKFTNNKFTYKY